MRYRGWNSEKLIKIIITAVAIATAFVTPVYAKMDLETDAAVSGFAVALNNYFARTMQPEKGLAETVKAVAEGKYLIDTEDENTATGKLIEEATRETEPETIITADGATFATVYNTSTLRLRKEPDAQSTTLSLLAEGESYVVTGQDGDYFKVQVDSDLVGYVYKDYVKIRTRTKEELAEEAKAREEEQKKLKREAEEALKKLEEVSQTEYKETVAVHTTQAQTIQAQTTQPATITPLETRQQETAQDSTIQAWSVAQTKEPETIAAFIETRSPETAEAIITALETEQSETSRIETREAATETEESVKEETSTASAAGKTETASKTETAAGGLTKGLSEGPGGTIISGTVTDAVRNAIVAYAKQFLGGKYVWGGTDLTGGGGVDCSGFVMKVYERFGYSIGRTSRDQAAKGREISISEIQPGDLLFYASGGYINHVAMYIGNNQLIHASNSTSGIIISALNYRTSCKACTFLD